MAPDNGPGGKGYADAGASEVPAVEIQPECIGGDCRPEWNWCRTDCPVHGDAAADTELSEMLQRASEQDGALTMSFTFVVLPSLRRELADEGERRWREARTWVPPDWTEEDAIRYALARRLRGDDE